jgi:hypothetical protein
MRHRGVSSSYVLRIVLVANTVLLIVIGGACLLAYARPAAYVFSTIAWLGAVVLAAAARRTDPYRLEARRLRRYGQHG